MDEPMNYSGRTVLVSDVDRRKSVAIIQSLGHKGITVYGISNRRFSVGGFSKYCSKVFILPDYRKESCAYLNNLERICKLIKPDVFIPIEDELIELCLRNRKYWEPYTSTLLPDSDVFELCYDKWESYRAALECNLDVPFSICPSCYEDLELLKEAEGPFVVKLRKGSGSRGIGFPADVEEIEAWYRSGKISFGSYIVQHRIPSGGNGLGVFLLLDRKSNITALFGHKRLREYPLSGGPSSLCVSHRDQQLIDKSIAFAQKNRIVGPVMLEFKEDVLSKKKYLLDINPRFWGSLLLSIKAGVDFPFLYFKTTLGLHYEKVEDFETGIYLRWLFPADMMHFLKNKRRWNLDPSFFDFKNKKTYYDLCSMNDIMPTFGVFIETMRKFTSGK
jgi:predicted ATP-grasp superfamily ATP-dependent carboligase